MTDNNFSIFKRNLDDNKKIYTTDQSMSEAKSQQKKLNMWKVECMNGFLINMTLKDDVWFPK